MDSKKPITGFVIPKKRKADVPLPELVSENSASSSISSEIPPGGYEITEATEEEKEQLQLLMNKRTTIPSPTEESWNFQQMKTIEMIKNARLEHFFEEYKKRMKSEEVMGYRVVYEREEAESIAEFGVPVRSDCMIDISNRSEGVMIYNSPSLSYPGRFLYTNVPITIIAFRVAQGKRNEIPIGSGIIPPSKKHQSHVVMNTDALKSYNPFIAERMTGGVFHYEYDGESNYLLAVPRMILPYAIITYTLSPDAFAVPQGSAPEKFCKIHKTYLSFDLFDDCSHTIIMPGTTKKYDASLCKTVITSEVAFLLINTESRPQIVRMKFVADCYPALNIIRTGHDFGQLLKRENTYIAGYGSYCHYVLRFRNKPVFMDKLIQTNSCLVWERDEEWTVFYLPTGPIAAEFGFPHQPNCFHLVVYRKELKAQNEEAFKWTRNILSGDTEEIDRTIVWNLDVDKTHDDEMEFDDEVFDGDEEDESDAELVVNEETPSSTPSNYGTSSFASPDVSLPSPTFGSSPRLTPTPQYNPIPSPISTTPGPPLTPDTSTNSSAPHTPAEITSSPSTFVPKGIIRRIGSKPRNLTLRFVDMKYPELPNHVPRQLVAAKLIENYNEGDSTGMTFAEKLRQDHINEAKVQKEQQQQLEDEKKERTENGTDELFKNAMTSGRDVAETSRPTTLQNSASHTPTTSCNISLPPPGFRSPAPSAVPPMSSPLKSSTPPANIPLNFSQPPPNVSKTVPTPPVAPFHPFRPPPPHLPTNIPPPNPMGVPPPNFNNFQPRNFSGPPPPIIPNMTTPPPQMCPIPGISFPLLPPPKPPQNYKVPSPQGIPPPALVTPILSSSAARSSTDSHPSPSVALLSRPPMPVAISPIARSVLDALRRPSADSEIGEEPMEIVDDDEDEDEEKAVEEKKEKVPSEEVGEQNEEEVLLIDDEPVGEPKEEPNDILKMAFEQARPEPVKITTEAEKKIKNLIDMSEPLRALLASKLAGKAQSSSQDTDLRFAPRPVPVNFSIAQKPPATKPISNVLMTNDEDDEEGPSTSNHKQAGSSKDSDYRTPARRVSHDSFSRDRDDRVQDKDDRVANIPIPKHSPQMEANKRMDHVFQEKLRATEKDREKRANEAASMYNPTMLPGTFRYMFPSLASSQVLGEHTNEVNAAPSVEPSPSNAAPAPVAAAAPVEPQGYTPTTIFNLNHSQTESEPDKKYEEVGTSSSNANGDISQKKSLKKPRDFDSVEASESDERVRETWKTTTTAPKPTAAAPQPPIQQKEIELITLDDSDVEEGEIEREIPAIRRVIPHSRPQQFPQGQQYRGRGGYQGGHMQRGGHQGFFNQNPIMLPDPWEKIKQKPDPAAYYVTILVNEKDESLTPIELTKLFEGLLKLKQVRPPYSPRIQPSVYIHEDFCKKIDAKRGEKDWVKYNQTYTDFMKSNPPLVEVLPPNHISCQSRFPSIWDCISVVHKKRESHEAIYITKKFTEQCDEGRLFVQRGIKVMTIRELGDFIEKQSGQPMNLF
ncbi:hypothetical protein CAEBREN_30785 [Caenorhabditis brenneri]|uniref:Uncharacterized protein n=1 Tax=Caenorhabditis brenneri TaxID=135651 RepID=G0P907_CAEBE|nr:hypothetical protein CAEBREN_30785 [Caenorhabditis brenneri]